MRSILPITLLGVLLTTTSAPAQCIRPGFGWGWGFGGPRFHAAVWSRPFMPAPWGFNPWFSYRTAFFNPWVVPAPMWGGPFMPVPWGFSYWSSFSTPYFNPWVVPPPMPIPLSPTPGVFTIADTKPTSGSVDLTTPGQSAANRGGSYAPTRGGVDLAELRKKLTDNREAEQLAKQQRVEDAVKSGALVVFEPDNPLPKKAEGPRTGEFVVFEPGKPLPKRAEVPPAKVPDSPKPAEAVAPKPEARPPADPVALARFHLHRGQTAFDAGELGRATERFAAAVAADPKLGEAYFNLAQVRIARGQYAEAMEAIRNGMKNVPGWAAAPWSTSDLYLAHPKRLTADVDDLKAAVAAAPTDSTLQFLYAHHQWFSGDKTTATELFRQLDGKVKEKELVQPFLKK